MIYYGIFYIISFFSATDLLTNNKNKTYIQQICFAYCGIILFLMAAFRYKTGFDYNNYLWHFQEGTLFEPGYYFISKIGKALGNFSVVIFLAAVIGVLPKLYFIKKYSNYIFISLLFYFTNTFLMQDFGQIRQGMAQSFILFAIIAYGDKRKLLFFVLIILAIFFHYSAIIPLLLFPFLNINIKRSLKFYILLGFLAISFINIQELVQYIVSYFPSNYFTFKVISYLDKEPSSGFAMINILRFVLISFYLYYEKSIQEKEPRANLFFNVYFIGAMFSLFFFSFSEISIRGGLYFKIFDIFIFTYVFSAIRDIFTKYLYFCLVLLYNLYSLMEMLNFQPESFYPFRSIFFK